MAPASNPASTPVSGSQKLTPKDIFGSTSIKSPLQAKVEGLSDQELAQALMERLTLAEANWHSKKSNRAIRAKEQVAAALVYLLKGDKEEALPRLEQAVAWLNRSISAPPCPDHGDRK